VKKFIINLILIRVSFYFYIDLLTNKLFHTKILVNTEFKQIIKNNQIMIV
jgi:hypothetical protein